MKISEASLATHFIDSFLTDCEVYKEVPCGGIIDIISVKAGIITSYEAKTTFSFDVIEQANKNKSFSHYAYVLVPQTKSHTFANQICRDYGIGIITVLIHADGRMSNPHQTLAPKLNRKIHKPKLCNWQKLNIAGVQSGRITAFSNTVKEVTGYLQLYTRSGRCETKKVLSSISHHYGSTTSAASSLMSMVRAGVIKDFYFEKGFMILTPHHQRGS